jgi:hypothetical protein
MSSVDHLALRIWQLERNLEDVATAARRLHEARFRSKAHFERKFRRKVKDWKFKRGELVLVRNKKIESELNKKSKPRWLGPYEVLRRTRGGSYVLRQPDGAVLREGVGAYRLSPYMERDMEGLREWAIESEIDSNPESDSPSESE